MGIWTWFVGTKLGRWLSGAFALIAFVFVAYWRGRAAGIDSQKRAEDKNSLKNLRQREKTDDEVDRMPASARDDELSKWVSDDK